MRFTATARVSASPPDVFRELTDHEGMVGLPGVTAARLLRAGAPERNGVGAIREVRVRGLRFVEEIVGYEPHRRIDYRIRECTLPLRHEFGRIDLDAVEGGTRAHWESELSVPGVGWLLGPLMRRMLPSGFEELLAGVEARIHARAAERRGR